MNIIYDNAPALRNIRTLTPGELAVVHGGASNIMKTTSGDDSQIVPNLKQSAA
jgi:hypothetical protein